MLLLFYFIFLTQIPYLCRSHKDPTLALLDTGTSFLSFMLVFLSVMTVILQVRVCGVTDSDLEWDGLDACSKSVFMWCRIPGDGTSEPQFPVPVCLPCFLHPPSHQSGHFLRAGGPTVL